MPRVTDPIGGEREEWPFALVSLADQRQFSLGTYTHCESFRRKEAERAPADFPPSAPRRPAR